jgi:hypothetical protein
MLPIHLVSLLTSAKSFRDNPVIGSFTLNSAGLHILRLLVARLLTSWRWMLLAGLMPKAERKSFHKDGFVIVPDFLPAADISAIRGEIAAHTGDVRQMTQGNTATQRILLDIDNLNGKPALKRICHHTGFINRLRYCAAKLTPPLLYVQRIRNGFRDAAIDPQKTMHADTFHPTMKAWLFLEDVTPEKGPFTYVRGSNRLTWHRIVWEYRRSRTAAQNPDGYSEKGSFRASPEDLKAMQLENPSGICVSAGTLVIANTNGFHGRGTADDGQSRLEIWAYSRPSPFNPLPGLPFNWLATLQNTILQRYWQHKDRKAARRNSRPSWHLIPANKMTDLE